LIRVITVVVGAGVLALAAAAPAQAEPLRPRGPHDKVPAGSVAYIEGASLIIAIPTKDGGGSAAIYETVGGAQELLEAFKARGIVDPAIPTISVADGAGAAPGAEAPSTVAGEGPQTAYATPPNLVTGLVRCNSGYGMAAYIAAGSCSTARRLRWRDTAGFADPQVYYRDHTPSRHPVGAAITSWNGSNPHIDLYHQTSGSCPSGRHCIHVYNANYGPDPWGIGVGWVGYTYVQWDSSFFFRDGQVVVHFNDYYPANAHNDRQLACHELGHSLGLHHNGSTTSCIYAYIDPSASTTPNSSDFSTFQNVIYP
jgi:hypothetical protein